GCACRPPPARPRTRASASGSRAGTPPGTRTRRAGWTPPPPLRTGRGWSKRRCESSWSCLSVRFGLQAEGLANVGGVVPGPRGNALRLAQKGLALTERVLQRAGAESVLGEVVQKVDCVELLQGHCLAFLPVGASTVCPRGRIVKRLVA